MFFRTFGRQKVLLSSRSDHSAASISANKQETLPTIRMPPGRAAGRESVANTGGKSKAQKVAHVGSPGAGRHTVDMYS